MIRNILYKFDWLRKLKGDIMIVRTIKNPEVSRVFMSYPENIRNKLMDLRQLIIDLASETQGVGMLEETLKWGQPSYLTTKPKSGTTIRIDWVKTEKDQYAMYFHCQTSLISTFREIYPDLFNYEGNRSIVFNERDEIPINELSHCIKLALTYHLNK